MPPTPSPMPTLAPVTLDPRTQRIGPEWQRWLLLVQTLLGSAAQQIGSPVTLTRQSTSLPTTSLPLPTLATGPYRVSVYGRITQPAATSSSLQVTIGWTEGGLALTAASPVVTGNTVTATLLFQTLVQIDPQTAITYATTYASAPAGQMQYSLNVLVEGL